MDAGTLTTIPDDLIPLSAAAKLLPAKRGQKVHTCTLWRWVQSGKLRGWDHNGLKVSRQEVLLLAIPRRIPVPRKERRPSARTLAAYDRQVWARLKRHGILPAAAQEVA